MESSSEVQLQEKIISSILPHSCRKGSWFVLQMPSIGQVLVCVNRPTSRLMAYLLSNPKSNSTIKELASQASVSERTTRSILPKLVKLGVVLTSTQDSVKKTYGLNTNSPLLQWIGMLGSDLIIRAAA